MKCFLRLSYPYSYHAPESIEEGKYSLTECKCHVLLGSMVELLLWLYYTLGVLVGGNEGGGEMTRSLMWPCYGRSEIRIQDLRD